MISKLTFWGPVSTRRSRVCHHRWCRRVSGFRGYPGSCHVSGSVCLPSSGIPAKMSQNFFFTNITCNSTRPQEDLLKQRFLFCNLIRCMAYSLEVVSHLKLIHLVSHVSLHFRVGVVDDGQEHVDQDKEYEEDKQHEEDRSQVPVGSLQLMEVKVSQDDTEQCEARERMDKFLYIYSAGVKIFRKKIKDHNCLTKSCRNCWNPWLGFRTTDIQAGWKPRRWWKTWLQIRADLWHNDQGWRRAGSWSY